MDRNPGTNDNLPCELAPAGIVDLVGVIRALELDTAIPVQRNSGFW